jgi:ParB family transcriptional regulator, chromosome partitioning protein
LLRVAKKPKPGIGRGLEAILSVSRESEREKAQELRELPVELIIANPKQPRRRFDEDALQALAGSLGDRGVLQPVLVRPKPGGTYELVAGERRWRAAQLARIERIPALVRAHDDAEAIELALIENMAREDLNPIEEARACAALVEELGITREDVGRRVGRSRVAVSNLLRLLDLPDEAIALLEDGALSAGHGRALLLAEDHGSRAALAREAAREGWSVRTAEAKARELNAAAGVARPARARRRRLTDEPHPDQLAATREIADALEAVLGAEVAVSPARGGGYRAELSFATATEAVELARRLRPRAVA